VRDAAAVIVAAGRGLRFGGRQRKQYLLLEGRPLVEWSIRAFDQSPSIGMTVVVSPAPDVPKVQKLVQRLKLRKPVRVTAGGQTRAESVQNGLRALDDVFQMIAVHDGVRPLVTPKIIEATLKAARQHGAAIAACRSKDTVKLANGDACIHSTPPRESVWLAQTPQIFRRDILLRAHAESRDSAVTDDAQLVERLGLPVKLVESPPDNLKVTVPTDLDVARHLVKSR
jgi:2-C-methyl-D-erythritol 4-phosphate cytidylyltransferase